MAASTRGRLLVATPTLHDPNFSRTVVLVLEHTPAGALGVVLNRPSETGVRDALPPWSHLAGRPEVVFVGGPVAPTSALGLARAAAGAAPIDGEGWVSLSGGLGTVDLEIPPGDIRGDIEEVRIFAGYAGWGDGQLDAELEAEGWFVVDALPDDAFTREPERLWAGVLRRQTGRLAMFASAPRDPSVN